MPDPGLFGLSSFAELLPSRDHIPGEVAGSFDGFRAGMIQSLLPVTPYEFVIAENLIAIEWELLQHRHMRGDGLRKIISNHIRSAVIKREEAAHEKALDAAYEEHVEGGGTNDDWEEPFSFDRVAAKNKAAALVVEANPSSSADFATACSEIEEMGLNPLELMGEAYRTSGRTITMH